MFTIVNLMLLIGSYVHLLAAIGLLLSIWYNQHCNGISVKSQFLYTLVFTTRYLSLLTNYTMNAETTFKIAYIVVTYCTLLTLFFFWKSYQRKYDVVRVEMLIIPCLVMAGLVNNDSNILGILWTFSIYLEAVAMIPQFQFSIKAKHIQPSAFYYVDAIGVSKALSSIYWTYQYYSGDEALNLKVASNVIQLVLFCDFFFHMIMPGLFCGRNKNPKNFDAITIENCYIHDGLSKTSHIENNVSTVLYMPHYSEEENKNTEDISKGKGTI